MDISQITPAMILQWMIIGVSYTNTARYATVASYTIQVYETILCFQDEYLYIHKARWTSVKVAYFFCRYIPLFYFPVVLWAWVLDHPLSVCRKVALPLNIVLNVLALCPPAVIFIRTYAFTGRNRLVFALLFTCYAGLVALYFAVSTTKFTHLEDGMHRMFGESGCFVGNNEVSPNILDKSPQAVLTIASLIFDLLMTAIVIVHCFRFRTTFGPLGKAFIVQGLAVFIIISAVHLAVSIIYLSPARADKWYGLGVTTLILPNILACRLILALRRQVNPTATDDRRKASEGVRSAIRNLEIGGSSVVDDEDSEGDKPIEHWD